MNPTEGSMSLFLAVQLAGLITGGGVMFLIANYEEDFRKIFQPDWAHIGHAKQFNACREWQVYVD